MLKIGDKVRVTSNLVFNDYIDGYFVTYAMYSKRGKIVTISAIFNEEFIDRVCYEVEELNNFGVAFTESMFDLANDDEDK